MTEQPSQEKLIALIRSGQKIAAIKFLREHEGLSLVEAKSQVEQATDALREAGELPDDFAAKKGCGTMLLFGLLPFFAILIIFFI